VEDESAAFVESEVAKAEQFTDSPTQMFDYVYSKPTADLQREKQEFKEFYNK
jgi:hypothetical protein